MIAGISRGRFRICYHPVERISRELEFSSACELVMLARNTVFVVDEIWRFCRGGYWMPAPLEDIAFTGRHTGTTLVFTAQRPAKVAKDLLCVATSHRLFRMSLGLDVRAMRDHAGVPDEVRAKLPSLPDRVHFFRDEKLQWHLQR